MLTDLTRLGRRIFLPGDLDMCREGEWFRLVQGHRQLTDAYLVALAARSDARLVTLDRRLIDLLPAGSANREAIRVLR